MNNFFKQIGRKWLGWAARNPKKFFIYSMIFLSVSFVVSLVQGIFFPSENNHKITPPMLYSKNKIRETHVGSNEKEMEKIVNELKALKVKRDRNELEKKDSLRIEYLFNQFQKLKHGH